jgi:2,3-bisphosphoglycerate-dependent phosphoglycerate mutase
MKLLLVRHGESVGNFEGRLQGHTDYPLTERGREQALLTADRLRLVGVTDIYSSPLLRALTTAEVIGERIGKPPIDLPGVREYDFGQLAGSTYAEVRQRFAAEARDGAPQERLYPGEEGREAFFERVTEAVWGVIDGHPGESVAVVAHGGPIALICQSILGLPYRRPMPFAVDNCSITTIAVRDEPTMDARQRTVLLTLNDTCHLAGLGRRSA